MSVEYEHVVMNLSRPCLAAATIGNTCSINTACDQIEFHRIFLTEFRCSTSRSHYRSLSKQTTRIWMAFGGNTRDLGSFREETDKITDPHQIHEEVFLTERKDGVTDIKRRCRDVAYLKIMNPATAQQVALDEALVSTNDRVTIRSCNVFSIWMAFGGNTRDLGSFREETEKITDPHQIHEEVFLTERKDGVTDIKRRCRDLSSNGVRNLATAERIKELELRMKPRNNFEEELFMDMFHTEEEFAYHKEQLDFMILEDLGNIIDSGLSEVVLGKPFVKASKLTYDESLGLIRFAYGDDEVVFRMLQRIKE
nr:protein kinase-like domain, concanavalin A-like lectin/glucanase domain protein [Tanacetum cinerariifolium]